MKRIAMLLIAAIALTNNAGLAGVPERTASWTTLEVPPEHAAMGQVYYVKYPAHSAQVTFVSNAPIERLVGTSHAVVGYLVAEMENEKPTGRILAGAFRLPVASFETGIAMRDGHLRGRMFLNADEYPEITVLVNGSDNVTPMSHDDGVTEYSQTLRGDLTIKSTTKAGLVSASVRFMKGSDETKPAGKGDVAVLKCSYSVKRSEFDVGPNFMPHDLVDTMEIEQFVVMSTVSADESAVEQGGDPGAARFAVLYNDFDDADRAFAMADSYIEEQSENPKALIALVWSVILADSENGRCQDLAMRAALQAVDITDAKDADILSAVAFLHAEKNELGKAVEWQRKAVAHKETSKHPDRIEMMMKRYEAELAQSN